MIISKTCISIIKTRTGKLLMAGDRRASWDWGYAQSMPKPKIAKRDGILIGATGDGFLCSLFVNVMEIPERNNENLDIYIFKKFRDAVFKQLLQNGMKTEHNLLKIPGDCSVGLLIGIEGKAYEVNVFNPTPGNENPNGLIYIDEVNVPYAIGCGSSSAIPILIAEKQRTGFNTKDHLVLAMNITGQISPGCDNNIDIIQSD